MPPMNAKVYMLLLSLVVFTADKATAANLTTYQLYLPHVVKAGNQIETSILISNPGLKPIEVRLFSFPISLLDLKTIQVEPGTTRRIEIKGEDTQVGAIRLESPGAFTAISSIRHVPSGRELSVAGQSASSKIVIPVFRGITDIIDETIVSIFMAANSYSFALRDPLGNLIASRTTTYLPCAPFATGPSGDIVFTPHLVQSLSALFPNLPTSFRSGSLTIERTTTIPQGFAVAVFYAGRDNMWSPATNGIGKEGVFVVVLKIGQTGAEQIASDYGLTVRQIYTCPPYLQNCRVSISSTAPEGVALVLARDPRVELIEEQGIGCADAGR